MQPLPAKLEDGVAVKPIERSETDELVVELASDGPLVGPVGERVLEPRGVQLDGDLGRLAGALEAPLFGAWERVLAGGDELLEEDRQFAGCLDLDPLPRPDLRHCRSGLGFFQVRCDGLESAGDRVEPLGQWGVIAREQQEQPVADGIEGRRATLPDSEPVGIEDRAADVVALDVALEGGFRREAGRVERVDFGEVRPIGIEPRQERVPTPVTEEIVVRVEAEARSEDRVLADEVAEPALDEVVEPVVEGTGIGAARGPREVARGVVIGHGCPLAWRVWVSGGADRRVVPSGPADQAVAAAASTVSRAGAAGRVSASAARVAWIVVSISAAVMP